ncbi:DNA polymerase III subunit gamma/tau [Frigidibacter sp. MR17.24]|uniref:DNA polymerase III subunit gamma/tau n=1 Tax=Frigidibacter sp. MR17.24 TaxID=3127345 RepID=UPI003012C925
MSDAAETTPSAPYQVLARKYRPATFADLIGQEAMVRTLRNAFAADRIAQAFVMTGIRGTGKTTTARIIAKGLNCIGPDGSGGPTTDPCLECEHCRAIAEGRHVDVLEMDAASRTGVGDIREIIESVHYRAASARYKVYIIDEVHMLSTSAFNALLKTLEEPPAHVKFIFATTEIRKVPVTVLSRCQRFDLKRIEPEVMIDYLGKIATREGAAIAPDALALIARAAEGSVRDAMSLTDQAIAHGAGETTADQVRAMLGLADRGRVLDLFDLIMKGDAAGALTEIAGQYADGADPMAVLRDLAEVTHWISVVKITPDAADDPTVPPDERARGQALAAALAMPSLSRMWQMLLKALEEVSIAPNAMMAAEMAIIRLTHVAEMPDPERILRRLQEMPATGGAPAGGGIGGGTGGGGAVHGAPRAQAAPQGGWQAAPGPRPAPAVSGQGAATALARAPEVGLARYARFDDVVELIRDHRDMTLLVAVETGVRLVHYAPGRIEFEQAPDARRDLAATLAARLQTWTGQRWGVSVVGAGGAETIAETRARAEAAAQAEAAENPVVAALLAAFPGAKISVTPASARTRAAASEALPEVEDEWDPFEDS